MLSLPKLNHNSVLDSRTLPNPLSPGGLCLSLSLSRSESIYALTHFNSSPDLPSLEGLPTSRYEGTAISSMTHRENEKLGRRLADLNREEIQRLPLNVERMTLSPTERDFRRVLDRLEKVTSAHGALGRINLKPGKPYESNLDEGDKANFRVFTRGEPCPLRILLRRTGKTLMCVSRHEMEPSEAICDAVTRSDKLSISDPGLKFKCDNIFITVSAMEDIKMTLILQFGREVKTSAKLTVRKTIAHRDETFRALEELKRDETLLNDFYDKVEKIEKAKRERALQRCKDKDFVELNKAVSPLNSDRSQNSQMLTQRISQALAMRARNMQAKKQRALAMIFRKEQLQEIARLARAAAEIKQHLQEAQKSVLTTTKLTVSLECLYEMLQAGKRRAEKARRKIQAAVRIQRALRRWIRNLDNKGLALNLFRTSARFLLSHYGQLLVTQLNSQVKHCITESCCNQVLPKSVRIFHRKIASIKKQWREHAQRDQRRWAKLLALWAEVLEHLQADLAHKKSAAKKVRGKRRPEEGAIYYSISAAAKQTVLSRHMLECKRKHRDQVRVYLTATRMLKLLGRSAFAAKALEDPALQQAAPQLQYLPSAEEMARLIDSALIAH